MKEKLTNNLLLKIISAVAAVFLWVVVINIDNPTDTFTISNIPITVLNEKTAITNNDLTYELEGDQTASVEVTTRRTDRRSISASDFEATIDMNEIYSATGSVAVNITVVGHQSKIRSFTPITRSVRVNVEEMLTKEFEIGIEQNGDPAESYAFSGTVSPASVKVTAPKSIMDTIDRAVAAVDVEGASDNLERTAAIRLLTAGGKEINLEDERISMNETEVQIQMNAAKTSQINISVDLQGQDSVAEGCKFIGYTCTPSSVSVTGPKLAIADLDKIVIREDLTGRSENFTKIVHIRDLLSEGIKLAEGQKETVEITFQIEKLVHSAYVIPTSQIVVEGKKDSLNYSFGEDGAVVISLQGLKEDLDALDSKQIHPLIDVSAINRPGVYEAEISLSLPTEFESCFENKTTVVKVVATEIESMSPEGGAESSSSSESQASESGSTDPAPEEPSE